MLALAARAWTALALALALTLAGAASVSVSVSASADDATSPTLVETSTTHRRRLSASSHAASFVHGLNEYEVHDFHAHAPSRRALVDLVGQERIEGHEMRVLGRRITLDLDRWDDLFAPEYSHELLGEDGSSIESHGPSNCVYKVSVREDPAAGGAMTLCNGLVHLTVHGGEHPDFTVQPAELEPEAQHVVYRHKDIKPSEKRCGNDHGPLVSSGITIDSAPAPAPVPATRLRTAGKAKATASSRSGPGLEGPLSARGVVERAAGDSDSEDSENSDGRRRRRRDLQVVGSSTKYFGVVIVNDQQRYSQYGVNTHIHAAQIFAVVASLYAKIGVDASQPSSTYKFQIEIIGAYTFAVKNPWAANTDVYDANGNAFAGSNDRPNEGLLYRFNQWRSANARPAPPADTFNHDIGHLLSGSQFQGSTIGLASLHALCNANLKSGITMAVNLADAQISSTAAHEIGHNVGANHDDDTPPSGVTATQCNDKDSSNSGKLFVMDSSSSTAHTDWSPCTMEWFRLHFATGSSYYNAPSYPACAETKTNPSLSTPYWSSGTAVCGDGLRQGSEQCDCPNGVCTGIDACCQSDCTLKPGCACSALDSCCTVTSTPTTTTSVINTNTATVCRAATSTCDIAETCDGVNAACPADKFKASGTACTTPLYSSDGVCFNRKCLSHTEQCKTYGPVLSPARSFTGPCQPPAWGTNYGPTGGAQSCGYLRCLEGSSCLTVFVTVAQGTQCQTGKGCYDNQCVPFERIPIPGNPNCTNSVVDQDETDVDCGGTQCYGCAANKLCKVDADCAYPSGCNVTVLYTGRNGTDYGRCTTIAQRSPAGSDLCFGNEVCAGIVSAALKWFQDYPYIWGPIVGVLGLLCIILCCVPARRTPNGNVSLAQHGFQQASSSFRNLRTNGSFRGGPIPQADEVQVAKPV